MPFDDAYVRQLTEELRSKDVEFDSGLRADEINQIEKEHALTFPPDLRMLLEFALPISEGFPNWRTGSEIQPIIEWTDKTPVVTGQKLLPLSDRLTRPSEGICFDIEHSSFWVADWGPKPLSLSAALEIARKQIGAMPRLIPICGHRYLPNKPFGSGNPVFSVHQTDVIYYGNDLADYFACEFGVSRPEWAADKPREIPFWSDLASGRFDSL